MPIQGNGFPSFSFHNVRYDVRRAYDNLTVNPKKNICLVALGAVAVVSSITGTVCGIYHLANLSNKLDPDIYNGTNVTTPSPFTSTESSADTTFYTNITSDELENITKAIEGGEKKWGTDETVFQEPTTALTTLSTTSTTSTTSATSAETTTQLTDDGVTVANPMVLDDQVMSDLKAHGFSKERIEYWLAKGLNINARDDKEFNWTLLMHVIADKNEAARTDHKDVVKYLLQQKDIDLSAKGYVNLIQWAVGRGDSVAVGLILETHPEIDLDTYKDSNNLVHLAAQGGFVDVLAELKGHIANYHLTEKNKYGKTPVEVAQENGHQPFVDALQKLIDNME